MRPEDLLDAIGGSSGVSDDARMCVKGAPDDAVDNRGLYDTGVSTSTVPAPKQDNPLTRDDSLFGQYRRGMQSLLAGGPAAAGGDFVTTDDALLPALRSQAAVIAQKNVDWWQRMKLYEFYPYGRSVLPVDRPNRYANITFRLQRFFNNSGISKLALGHTMSEDGIMGGDTMNVFLNTAGQLGKGDRRLAGRLRSGETESRAYSLVSAFLNTITGMQADNEGLVLLDTLWRQVFALHEKPRKIAEWNFISDIQHITSFLRTNDKELMNPLSTAVPFSHSQPKFMRRISQNDEEAQHLDSTLEFEDKMQMLEKLYENRKIPVTAIYFEVHRFFVDPEDLNTLKPRKDHPELDVSFIFNNADYTDKAAPLLQVNFPKTDAVKRARAQSRTPSEGKITGLAIFHFLPKPGATQLQNAKAFAAAIAVERDSEQQAALAYIENLQKEIERRQNLPADITDVDTFMDIVTYMVPDKVPKKDISYLIKTLEDTQFLTFKLDEKSDIQVLPVRQIIDWNEKAQLNATRPLRMGMFKPPADGATNVDTRNFTAKEEENGDIVVFAGGAYETWPNRRYEQEPVRVLLGQKNPGDNTVTLFYRQVTHDVWTEDEHWVMSSMLPEAGVQFRKYLDGQLAAQGLDIVITTISAGFTFGGALLSTTGTSIAGGLLGSLVTVPLRKALIKALFWFVVSEIISQKIQDFDHKINTDPKYSDTDRKVWNTFKIGLFILGGAMIVRMAWKGLRHLGSHGFKQAFVELDEEIMRSGLALKKTPLLTKLSQVLKVKTDMLVVAKKWAKDQLGLAAHTIRDLTDDAIKQLKTLPEWALNEIRKLKDAVVRGFFGCKSPCRLKLDEVKMNIIDLVVTKIGLEKIRGIMPAEIRLLREMTFEAWDRVIQYAIRNRWHFSVKGKIAEELFISTRAFKDIYKQAVETAAKEGIEETELVFAREIQGIAPRATSAGNFAELTDGMIVAIKKDPKGVLPDRLRVYAVFESKSPSNLGHLAQKPGSPTGQMVTDFERLREVPTRLEIDGAELVFDEANILVSRKPHLTQWVGVRPPGEALSPALMKHLQTAFPGAKIIEGPVRNEILNGVALGLKKAINYLPKE